jgi:LPS sulfotransferase NodH
MSVIQRVLTRLRPALSLGRAQGLIVCAVPRSGSNYLSQLMESTGVLGIPREYFNGPGRRHYDDPNYPDDPRAQLALIRSRGATPNGIYGLKIHPFQVEALKATLDPFTELPGARAVLLRRGDLLAQGISWARVQQTKQHRASDAQHKAPTYDSKLIRKSTEFIERQNRFWRKYLKRRGIVPVQILYEDLYRDPQAQIDRIRSFIGLREAAPIDTSLISVTVQRNESSEEWRQRFITEGHWDEMQAAFAARGKR